MNIVRKESPELLINFRNLNDSTIRFLTRESVIRRRRQSRRDLNTRKSKQENTCRLFHELIDPKTPLYHLFHQTKKENSRKYHKLSHHTFLSRGKKKLVAKPAMNDSSTGYPRIEREKERERKGQQIEESPVKIIGASCFRYTVVNRGRVSRPAGI